MSIDPFSAGGGTTHQLGPNQGTIAVPTREAAAAEIAARRARPETHPEVQTAAAEGAQKPLTDEDVFGPIRDDNPGEMLFMYPKAGEEKAPPAKAEEEEAPPAEAPLEESVTPPPEEGDEDDDEPPPEPTSPQAALEAKNPVLRQMRELTEQMAEQTRLAKEQWTALQERARIEAQQQAQPREVPREVHVQRIRELGLDPTIVEHQFMYLLGQRLEGLAAENQQLRRHIQGLGQRWDDLGREAQNLSRQETLDQQFSEAAKAYQLSKRATKALRETTRALVEAGKSPEDALKMAFRPYRRSERPPAPGAKAARAPLHEPSAIDRVVGARGRVENRAVVPKNKITLADARAMAAEAWGRRG